MVMKYEDWLINALKDADFRAEYEALEAEKEFMQAVIDAHRSSGITEDELAARSGVKQSIIHELESGQTELTIKLLQQLARGLDRRLHIELVPA